MKNLEMKARPGISLVEIVVAMTIMAVVLSGLGGMAFSAARSTNTLTMDPQRPGVLQQENARYMAMAFDNIAGSAGCRTLTGTFPHQRCAVVSSPSTTRRDVTIIVNSTLPGTRPDTVVLVRTRAPLTSVLSTF
jgi:Tfp pilus assembly protein PilW